MQAARDATREDTAPRTFVAACGTETLSGWGRVLSGTSTVYRPSTEDGVRGVFDLARRQGTTVGLRGAGQSYGDAALNSDAVVLDLSRMTRVLAWDPERGRLRAEPGVTIGQVWRYALEDGWWPPVVPGTSFASLGGCAAMNVHGKNNFKAGPFGDHVEEIVLLLPSGERRVASRTRDADLFHAAIGGFGMLGCIVEIELALHRVRSGMLLVEPIAVRNLDEMLEVFAARAGEADYLVGWVDGFTRGSRLGRGLVHQGNYAGPEDDGEPSRSLRVETQELPDTILGVVPKSRLWILLRLLVDLKTMRAVNAVKYHAGRRENGHRYLQPLAEFSFLLDFIPRWGLAYGQHGMIQYQSFIPRESAAHVFREQIAIAQHAGLAPLLGVLKQHRRDAFWMSHAVDGYSLALEFRVTAGNRGRLWEMTHRLDALVRDAGGRFYFAKDSTLSRDSVSHLLGEERVQRFLALKGACDPDGLLQTDLYRRLFHPAARR